MNKYEVQGIVGEGAYGLVLKCRNKETDEIVAIKKFKDSDEEEIVRKTTIREVKILKMLKQENVVQLKEAFRRQGKLYLVFEYVEKNLLEILQERSDGIETELIKKYIYQLCQAIAYCHGHEVIHRDIKPENLLISDNHMLKLCDFGFARTIPNKCGALTDYVATRWYRAPELLIGTGEYGKEVDVWAIGCIMGELVDGQPVFPGESEVDQIYVTQKVLGSLTTAQMEIFSKNERFIGLKIPQVTRPETIFKRYRNKLSEKALDFMHKCLQMDPESRLTAAEACQHPWFDNIREEEEGPKRIGVPISSQAVVQPPLSRAGNRKNRQTTRAHQQREEKREEKSHSPPPLQKLHKPATKVKVRKQQPSLAPEEYDVLELGKQRSSHQINTKHTSEAASSLPPDTGFRIRACKKKHYMDDHIQEELKASPPVLAGINKKQKKHMPDPMMFEGGFNNKQLSSRGYIPRQSVFSKALQAQESTDPNTGSTENLHQKGLPQIKFPAHPRMQPRAEDPDSAGGPGPINPFFKKESHVYNHYKQTQLYNYDMKPERQLYY